MFQIPTLRNSAVMWDSGGDKEDYSGSGDYANYEEDDNGTSSIQFSFTNVENNRSEESVIELPGMTVDRDLGLSDLSEIFRAAFLWMLLKLNGQKPYCLNDTSYFRPAAVIAACCFADQTSGLLQQKLR